MAKVTRQASGVVAGDVDVSQRTVIDQDDGIAASALARRKMARLRGKKALARAKAAKTAKTKTVPGTRKR